MRTTSSLELVSVPRVYDAELWRKDVSKEGRKAFVKVGSSDMRVVSKVLTIQVIPAQRLRVSVSIPLVMFVRRERKACLVWSSADDQVS